MTSRRFRIAHALCRVMPPMLSPRVREFIYPFRYAASDSFEYTLPGITGSHLRNTTSESAGYIFSVHGYLAWRNLAIARSVLRPGDNVMEIGANIGTETIGYLDIVGKSGQVFAFEPNPICFESLKNIKMLNDAENLHIFNVAVGNKNEDVQFLIPFGEQSQVGRVVSTAASGDSCIKVECLTIDSLLDYLGILRLITIDVEGFEVAVLKGAKEYLSKSRPIILIEAKSKHLRKFGHTLADLQTELRRSGSYSIFGLSRFGIKKLLPSDIQSYDGDWLCLPEEEEVIAIVRRVNKIIRVSGMLPMLRHINPIAL